MAQDTIAARQAAATEKSQTIYEKALGLLGRSEQLRAATQDLRDRVHGHTDPAKPTADARGPLGLSELLSQVHEELSECERCVEEARETIGVVIP